MTVAIESWEKVRWSAAEAGDWAEFSRSGVWLCTSTKFVEHGFVGRGHVILGCYNSILYSIAEMSLLKFMS